MFSGSMVAIVTPMTADGGLDWPAWDRLLDFHVREGSDGIVVAGTTGESPALSVDEVEELTRRAVARCRGKVKVIVGAGTHSTAGTVARTRALSRLGVDAVLLVTPYYNKPTQEGFTGISWPPPRPPRFPLFCTMCRTARQWICCRAPLPGWRETRRSWRSKKRPDR